MAIGIVVSILRPAEFITHREHRDTLTEKKQGHCIALKAVSKLFNGGIWGLPLHPAVPAIVVIGSIAILLAVRQVVFVVVGIKIAQREPVMTGDEIDRCRRFPARRGIKIGGAKNPLNHVTCDSGISPQKASGSITVMAVPFHPTAIGRKVSHLIETACIPSLRNQIASCEDRIKRESFQQGRIRQRMTVPITAQDRGQIKAKSVEMKL